MRQILVSSLNAAEKLKRSCCFVCKNHDLLLWEECRKPERVYAVDRRLSLLSSADTDDFVVVDKKAQKLFLYVIELYDVQSLVKAYHSVVLLCKVHNVSFASGNLKSSAFKLFF